MISKLSGGGALPPKVVLARAKYKVLLAWGTLRILTLCLLARKFRFPWLMAPFKVTCVVPLLQAANIAVSLQSQETSLRTLYFSCWACLIALYGFCDFIWSWSCRSSIMLMQYLSSETPPAGANPIVINLAGTAHVIGIAWFNSY